MRSMAITTAASAVAVVLMVTCLWAWQNAGEFFVDATRPYVATMAARSAAVALGAAAQVVLLTLVVGRLYPRQLLDEMLKLSAAGVMVVSLVAAVALALAAR
jgi:hypothetical protein